jgi:hypothetical protein
MGTIVNMMTRSAKDTTGALLNSSNWKVSEVPAFMIAYLERPAVPKVNQVPQGPIRRIFQTEHVEEMESRKKRHPMKYGWRERIK